MSENEFSNLEKEGQINYFTELEIGIKHTIDSFLTKNEPISYLDRSRNAKMTLQKEDLFDGIEFILLGINAREDDILRESLETLCKKCVEQHHNNFVSKTDLKRIESKTMSFYNLVTDFIINLKKYLDKDYKTSNETLTDFATKVTNKKTETKTKLGRYSNS